MNTYNELNRLISNSRIKDVEVLENDAYYVFFYEDQKYGSILRAVINTRDKRVFLIERKLKDRTLIIPTSSGILTSDNNRKLYNKIVNLPKVRSFIIKRLLRK